MPGLSVHALKLPLTTPYRLSFGDVVALDSFFVVLSGDGQIGAGEVTPLHGYSDESPETVRAAFDRLRQDLVDGAALSANFESDSVLSSDFWYVLYDADIQTSLSEIERDSILFTQSGAPVETARDADGMLIKHYWDVVYEQSDEPYTEYDLHGDFIFSGLNTSQAHVSGDLDVVVDETDPTASPEFNRQQTISATFTGFVIDENDGAWANGCPASGTVDATVQVQYQSGTAEPQVSNWTVQLTFINGTAQASVSDGDQDTTYVHTFRVPE